MSGETDRIREKLAKVRAQGRTCFGSDSHQFRLGPPLAEAEVAAFERAHGVRLPEDYRRFLLEVGHGGAGPYYGLYRLDQWDDLVGAVMDALPPGYLAAPFPGTDATIREGACAIEDVPERASRGFYQGTLSLGTQGCSYGFQLVVSGPWAGRILYVDADGQPPYLVREPSFLAWYERWLDELIEGIPMDWFGYGPSGDEGTLSRIAADREREADLRGEAVTALGRRPVSATTRALLVALVDDPEAPVRASACGVAGRMKLAEALPAIEARCGDPVARVREVAVAAVVALAPERAVALHARVFDEVEPSTAGTLFDILRDTWTNDELRRLAVTGGDPVRVRAVSRVTFGPEDRPLLLRLLDDPNPHVRRSAAGGGRHLPFPTLEEAYLARLAVETDVDTQAALLKQLAARGSPGVADTLLRWLDADDDFHVLDALEGLARLGDERCVPRVRQLLAEARKPLRRHDNGSLSHIKPIGELTRERLRGATSRVLRALAKAPA